jgi:hypothetical protein|tara:strand:+ start:371 stop:694 length:324 start_codon:yes stop_codon:yes gene_type:complete
MQTKQVAPIAQRENIKTNRAKMVAKIVIPDIIIRVILLSGPIAKNVLSTVTRRRLVKLNAQNVLPGKIIGTRVKLLVKIVRLENQTQWQGQIATYAPPGNINPRQLN